MPVYYNHNKPQIAFITSGLLCYRCEITKNTYHSLSSLKQTQSHIQKHKNAGHINTAKYLEIIKLIERDKFKLFNISYKEQYGYYIYINDA